METKITKQEILEFVRKCFPNYNSYSKERTLTIEIFDGEEDFLKNIFLEDFKSASSGLLTQDYPKGYPLEDAIFKSVSLAGQLKIDIKKKEWL
jgi:hypothetical protein